MVEDLVDRMPKNIEDVDVGLGDGAVRDILVDWCRAKGSLNDQPSHLQIQSLHIQSCLFNPVGSAHSVSTELEKEPD
jgi:hypothetical protein